LYYDGKKHAIPVLPPGLRQLADPAKVPGSCPDAALGNRPAMQAGSCAKIA